MEMDHFARTLGQNGTPCAILAPNGEFHCINLVQAVLWLIRLTNLRLPSGHLNVILLTNAVIMKFVCDSLVIFDFSKTSLCLC